MLDLSAPLLQPRAMGSSRLRVGAHGLTGLRQSGALKLLFPRRSASEAVIVNTAGGITGGDRFDLSVDVAQGADLTLTTQACERAYAASPGPAGRLSVRLSVDGTLHWLPQETLLFENCDFERELTVDLGPNARFLMVESVCFGRLARGEVLRSARFRDRVHLRRQGRSIFRDGVDLSGDIAGTLDRPAVASGARAMASVVLAAPDAGAVAQSLRDGLPRTAALSALSDDILLGRFLAADGFDLRGTLIPILKRLAGRDLPAVWRL